MVSSNHLDFIRGGVSCSWIGALVARAIPFYPGTKEVSPVPGKPNKTKEPKKPNEKSTQPKTQNTFKPTPQKKENPTEPKKPSQPKTTTNHFSKEPFPNQKHETDFSNSKPVPQKLDDPKPVPSTRSKGKLILLTPEKDNSLISGV
jgi:hypothetical protein